ncbi:UDP-glycosyltransferase UGT5-like [Teleopsis dalmanni]|uniref:UDP-glycosyltransferase UGT5-like n=1 Tax=Teleopsis dalmanni TaxID=139649 RepID=UPI0018CCB7A3|nr:UDP-glycosyltransferase UGT5-like [Teleopsis dalmanni]
MMHRTLIKELINREHKVTMVTAFSLEDLKLGDNYTEILIEPVYDFWDDIKKHFGATNLFELTSMTVFDFLKMLEILGVATTEHALRQQKVVALINAKKTEGVYDLLLAEQFYQEAFLALAKVYNIPVVTTSTLGFENHMSQIMGVLTPWSHVPHGFLPFLDRMTFTERLKNSFYSLYEDLDREYNYFPKMDELVQTYFSKALANLDEIPKVTQMEKNISALLLNSYVPLTTPRPTVAAMISVGGLHIYPSKPLPEDLQTFLDEAEYGAIYFALGSNVQSKDMPDEKLKMFLRVFSSIKQRVIWKFENESIPDLPKNVLIRKWLPQSDILAHPNTKLFITHGGLFSTQEGVHHAVPMLGIPFYCDQHLNMNKAVKNGYAISLHFQSINGDILRGTIIKLLTESTYRENIERISAIFHDRPTHARDTAMYWIEYVIRYKGASHMRSAGLDLKWYQYYLLDVIGFVLAMIILAVILVVILIRLMLKRIWRAPRVPKPKTN